MGAGLVEVPCAAAVAIAGVLLEGGPVADGIQRPFLDAAGGGDGVEWVVRNGVAAMMPVVHRSVPAHYHSVTISRPGERVNMQFAVSQIRLVTSNAFLIRR